MSSTVKKPRHTFRKSERLCSRKILETIVKDGKNIHLSPLRLVWSRSLLTKDVPAQVAFSVSKRNFKKSTDRNRIKRLMRESYRKNKTIIYSLISNTDIRLALLLIYSGKVIPDHNETEIKIRTILTKLAQEIKTFAG